MLWLAKATGAKVVRDFDTISGNDIGYAAKVYERIVGDDRMVFVDGCTNPKSITFLLRASSKILDEFHRTVLDSIYVLRNFIMDPKIVPGGGAVEAFVAMVIRERSYLYSGKEQIVIQKFAEALEDSSNNCQECRDEYYRYRNAFERKINSQSSQRRRRRNREIISKTIVIGRDQRN